MDYCTTTTFDLIGPIYTGRRRLKYKYNVANYIVLPENIRNKFQCYFLENKNLQFTE